jgi:hypothetical protein
MAKHPGGRPLKFKSVEELHEKIEAYFADCDPHPEEVKRYVYFKKTEMNKKGEEIEVDDTSVKPTVESYWGISRQKPYTPIQQTLRYS